MMIHVIAASIGVFVIIGGCFLLSRFLESRGRGR